MMCHRKMVRGSDVDGSERREKEHEDTLPEVEGIMWGQVLQGR